MYLTKGRKRSGDGRAVKAKKRRMEKVCGAPPPMYIAKRDKGSMDSVRTSFDAPRLSEDLQFCYWRHFWLADV